MLSIERGQFTCWPERFGDNCVVAVRFDNDKIRWFSVTRSNDYSNNPWFIFNARTLYSPSFITLLRKARVLHIEATFFHEGNHILEFNVAGLKL
jgi:hypothetical protein